MTTLKHISIVFRDGEPPQFFVDGELVSDDGKLPIVELQLTFAGDVLPTED